MLPADENQPAALVLPSMDCGASVHIEDTVRIPADGFETLTSNDLDIIEVLA